MAVGLALESSLAMVTYSIALPSMSCRPQPFGAFLPAGCVLSSELSQYQATASRPPPAASGVVVEPARQAYSHSASVGRRYFLPVFLFSHSQNCSAAKRVMWMAG